MANLDEIKDQNAAGKKPSKLRLVEYAQESLNQILSINEAHKRYFENRGDQVGVIAEIESRLDAIGKKYAELFAGGENGASAVAQLEQMIAEIKEYHKKLLDGDESIKADIADSQREITEFYNFLFAENEGKEPTVKSAIEAIEKFYALLTNEQDGYEKKIVDAHDSITKKYSELFNAEEGKKSKVKELDAQINLISGFSKEVNDKIKPSFTTGQQYLVELKKEIESKRTEINSLLSNATARTLAEGYLESMHIYGPISILGVRGDWKNVLKTIGRSLANLSVSAFNYFMFAVPLVSIAAIFIEPQFVKNWLQVDSLGGANLSGVHYIFYKISVSIPLLWVTWQGQRNIFQRKRLFEEYNHKLRVVQMYLLFITKENGYTLEKLASLEQILLDVINRNPSEVFGKDETMLDKLIELVRAGKGAVSKVTDLPKDLASGVIDKITKTK